MVILSDGDSIPNMRFFTIALFVKADSTHKSGTLFSYSVPNMPNDTIILSFAESKVQLGIKYEVVSADFKLADNDWHYLGVIWNGMTGNVSMYIDRTEVKRKRNVLQGNKEEEKKAKKPLFLQVKFKALELVARSKISLILS